MKFHRIYGILVRHMYLYRRSIPRLMDIFFWPVIDLLVWGFLSRYLEGSGLGGLNVVSVLLGALIFWNLLSQSQRAVSIVFLEDVWERNLLNIFVSPLRVSEFLVSTVLIGLVRLFLVGVVVVLMALTLYSVNLFDLGLSLVPFVINLLFFGWAIGLFATAIILRFGTSAQVLAFGLTFLIQPFSAVFYPVSALPEWARAVSNIFPSTHVFEGMRQVINTGVFPWQHLTLAVATNGVFIVAILWFFYTMFENVKEQGRLMKLD